MKLLPYMMWLFKYVIKHMEGTEKQILFLAQISILQIVFRFMYSLCGYAHSVEVIGAESVISVLILVKCIVFTVTQRAMGKV